MTTPTVFLPSIGRTSHDTMTCGLSQQPTEIGASISSAAASPAKTSVTPEPSEGLPASEAGYGQSSPGSLASFDHGSSLWKTSQRCLFEGWETFSETWPRSGTMRNGTVFRLPQLVPLNSATGCGLLPTLVAGDSRGSRNGTAKGRSLSDGMTMTDWLWVNVGRGTLDPGSAEQMMGFPEGWTDLDASATP
jgi:hypothetical protein